MLSAGAASRLRSPADDEFFHELRREEFGRLDRRGAAYLDYTGSALYGDSQLRAHHELLSEGLFGNPHAEHAASRASTAVIDAARELVLRFFGVDASTHDVCFTAGASSAIKLVAEAFPFGRSAPLLLAADNHNSMNGIREYARRAGAEVHVLPIGSDLRLTGATEALERLSASGAGLVGYPAQSNFSGVRHPLSLVALARARGHRVLLDAAAFAPTSPLDLREVSADFTVLSFYKLFGYPTGVGALVARREALAELRRPWFAGGTVRYASVEADTHRLLEGHAGFEDGTPDFLSIAALPAGFALLERAGMQRLRARVARLTAMFLDRLGGLRHSDGRAAVEVYGPAGTIDRGGTVAFNLLNRFGAVVPYWRVETSARDAGIALRGGCFCNPGAAEAALRLPVERTSHCLASLADTFTPERFAACLGSPVGALRASFGLATNEHDLERALEFLAQQTARG